MMSSEATQRQTARPQRGFPAPLFLKGWKCENRTEENVCTASTELLVLSCLLPSHSCGAMVDFIRGTSRNSGLDKYKRIHTNLFNTLRGTVNLQHIRLRIVSNIAVKITRYANLRDVMGTHLNLTKKAGTDLISINHHAELPGKHNHDAQR